MANKLVEIPIVDLPKLRDLYKIDWPKHHVGYYTLDNYIQWLTKDNELKYTKNIRIYSLNDDWNDGTFLVVDRYQVFFNSLIPNNERIVEGLRLLDWSHGNLVSAYLDRHKETVQKALQLLNLKQLFNDETILYFLPKEKASGIDVTLPDDIVLRSLSKEHACTIDNEWPFKHPGSLYYFERLIALNPNIGAFTKNGELVAWCLRLQAGALAALQVKKSHKRKGLGSVVTKAISKIIADMNQDIFAFVVKDNTPSKGLFEKLGFENLDTGYWLRPEVENQSPWVD